MMYVEGRETGEGPKEAESEEGQMETRTVVRCVLLLAVVGLVMISPFGIPFAIIHWYDVFDFQGDSDFAFDSLFSWRSSVRRRY